MWENPNMVSKTCNSTAKMVIIQLKLVGTHFQTPSFKTSSNVKICLAFREPPRTQNLVGRLEFLINNPMTMLIKSPSIRELLGEFAWSSIPNQSLHLSRPTPSRPKNPSDAPVTAPLCRRLARRSQKSRPHHFGLVVVQKNNGGNKHVPFWIWTFQGANNETNHW